MNRGLQQSEDGREEGEEWAQMGVLGRDVKTKFAHLP